LNKGLNSRELLRESFYEKVAFIPGGTFFPEEIEGEALLRLSFTYEKEDLIEEGVKRLSKAIKKLKKKSKTDIEKDERLINPIV
jgi:2-aminoadipate transaminase